MIGNAHIDPVWLWQWPEGYQEVRATFQSAVDRLDEYPDFVFTCDSSLFFRWVEESDSGAARADQRTGRSGPLPDRRRLVGRAGLQHPLRRVLRAPGALRPALPARHVRDNGHGGREHRLVRPQRHDPADPAQERMRLVRLPAARAARDRSSRRRSSGGSRPTAPACSPTGSRTSTAPPRTTSASTSRRRSRRCPTTDEDYRSSTASATTAAARRRRTSTQIARQWDVAAELAAGVLRRGGGDGEPAGCARRAPASRAGLLHEPLRDQALEPHARRTCSSGRRSGARSPTSLGVQAVPARAS